MKAGLRVTLRVALLLALGGCVAQGKPLIAERSPPPPELERYVVRKGDTLYSIAWRYNLDVKYLAARNGLSAPYTIFPGQRVALRGPVPAAARKSRPAVAQRGNAGRSKPRSETPSTAGTARTGERRSAPVTAPTAARATAPITAPITAPDGFRWPVRAEVSREFGRGNKGLDFNLVTPTKVRAAAAGEVVYAGTGLGGYLTYVILRHGGGYLSAYGFNHPARVEEGARVKVAEPLADIVGAGRAAKLHFEIRKDGEPISPRSVLR